MIGDLSRDGTQVEFRIKSVELGRADQDVHGRGSFSATIRSGEEEVLATKGNGAQRPFRRAVVDLRCAPTAHAANATIRAKGKKEILGGQSKAAT
jgi:hypothetical protein